MKNRLSLLALVASIALLSGCSFLFDKHSSNELSNNSSNEISSSESQSSSSNGSTSNGSSSSSQNTSSSSSSTSSSSSSSSSTSSSVEVINQENSNAVKTTIKKLISDNNDKTNTTTLYRITATAQWPNNTTYGNFDLVDDTGYIYVYGCSKNASSMTLSGNTYTFKNDKSYSQLKINPGDEITMEGLFEFYQYSGSSYGVNEFKGYVTSIKRNGLSTINGNSYTDDEPTNQAGTYYSSISSSESGTTLLKSLHNLMDTTHSKYIDYDDLSGYYKSSDKYSSSGVKCFYSGNKASSFNKEHVWPQSLSGSSTVKLYGTTYGGSDLHHVRPTISTYNSARGNAMYGTVYGNKSAMGNFSYANGDNTYYTQNVFEPADAIKGDVARIIMYMYVHYSSQTGGNSQTYYGEMHINWVMGPDIATSWKMLSKLNY